MPETLVIVGASLAGGMAAATLREEGFDGRVVLIGEEAQPPYERPPLSKDYLDRKRHRGERVLPDKHSEMKLDNLRAAGRAVRELKLA